MSRAQITVLLVDDSPFARRAFRRVLAPAGDVTVIGEAVDGRDALEKMRALAPQVVVLDLGMPRLDGLSALRLMRAEPSPPEVLVVSASAQRGAEATLAALEAGAFDFIDKAQVSSMQLHELGGLLLEKIRAAGARVHRRPPVWPKPEVLVLGASTGGPMALRQLLQELPDTLEAPVALVQHMPAAFLGALSERLGTPTRPAMLAQPGQLLEPRRIYVMPGGGNGVLVRSGDALRFSQRPAEAWQAHVPSVDALFASAAESCGARAWGVLLTGMGTDGAAGLLAIRRAGGLTVAQDEASSAVFGMPRAAIQLGAAEAVVPLHGIASFLREQLQSSRSSGRSTAVVVQPAPVGATEGSNA